MELMIHPFPVILRATVIITLIFTGKRERSIRK